jgi:hypothetical protein
MLVLLGKVCGGVSMLTYFLGPLFGLQPGPIALGLGTVECTLLLMAVGLIVERLAFRR